MERTRNSKAIGIDVELIPQIDDDDFLIGIQPRLQLFRRDAIDRQCLQKTLALNVFVPDVSGNGYRCDEQKRTAKLRQVRDQTPDFSTEYVTERRIGTRPKQKTGRVKDQKPAELRLDHSSKRYGGGVQAWNEFRQRQRPYASAHECIFSAANAVVRFQRYAADDPEHRSPVVPPEVIPDQAGRHSPAQRDQNDRAQ